MSNKRRASIKRRESERASLRRQLRREPLLLVLVGYLALPLVFFPWTFDPFAVPRVALLIPLTAVSAIAIGLHWERIEWRSPWIMGLGLLCLALLLSWMASVDRRNALLGNVGYRFGLVTWIALLAGSVLSSVIVRNSGYLTLLLRVGLIVAGAVGAYAVLQGLGADPFDWAEEWDRAFSTLGNPNDLAAFGVLATAFVGGLPSVERRSIDWRVIAGFLFFAGMVTLSGSRSGIAALLLATLVALGACAVSGWPAASLRRLATALATMVVVGLAVTTATGELGNLARRTVDTLDSDSPQSLSTRMSIWDGSLAAYRAHPLFGLGPDGLLVDFSRHQPGDLGYPFDAATGTGLDPLVGSPHSAALEVMVTSGPLALAAIVLVSFLVAARASTAVRRDDAPAIPFVLGAVVGFAAMALFNPLSIANVGVFVVLVGSLVGMATGAVEARRMGRQRRITGAAVVVGASTTMVLSGLLLAADVSAYRAGQADARRNDSAAWRHAHSAARLMPLDAAYARLEAQSVANQAFAARDPAKAADAERLQTRFLDRFAGVASDYLLLARLRIISGEPGAEAALAAALDASPHGIDTANSVAVLRTLEESQ